MGSIVNRCTHIRIPNECAALPPLPVNQPASTIKTRSLTWLPPVGAAFSLDTTNVQTTAEKPFAATWTTSIGGFSRRREHNIIAHRQAIVR